MTTIDINVPAEVRLGHLTIPGRPLLRFGALMLASEAMAQLGLDEPPPAMWQVEMDDVNALLADHFPGVAETADRHPLAMSVYRVDEEPIVLIQEGLPSLARLIIRHELAHLAGLRRPHGALRCRGARSAVRPAGGLGPTAPVGPAPAAGGRGQRLPE